MKIVTYNTLDEIPAGAVFLGEETEVIGWRFLVPDETSPAETIDSFVVVNDGVFTFNDQRIKFVGTNAYYLPTYENHDRAFCDRTWDLFAEAGINLVRTWGFYDGAPQYDGDPSFQRFENGEAIYNEMGLQCLDRTVAKAAEKGIRLIITLTNYHEQLGGYKEYCKAVGVPETFSAFMESVMAQILFRGYIHMLLNRKNTVTGRRYKDEPIIMAWEICNEARNEEKDKAPKAPGILRDWYRNIAQYIKSIDSNHLVATGEDGFEDHSTGEWGTDGKIQNPNYTVDEYSNTYVLRAKAGTSYLLNTAIPEIDFGSFHWYPINFGFGNTNSPELQLAQIAWLSDHAAIAKEVNKPVLLGEYGFHVDWRPDDEVYSLLWKVSEGVLDGDLVWQFVTTGVKQTESGGNIVPDRSVYNAFLQHIKTMKNG